MESNLRQAAKTYKAVLLTGARQVGKSTLLKHLFRDECRCISLDDPFLEEQAKTDGNMFLTLNPPPVIVDEVQYAPELFRLDIGAENQKETRKWVISLGSM